MILWTAGTQPGKACRSKFSLYIHCRPGSIPVFAVYVGSAPILDDSRGPSGRQGCARSSSTKCSTLRMSSFEYVFIPKRISLWVQGFITPVPADESQREGVLFSPARMRHLEEPPWIVPPLSPVPGSGTAGAGSVCFSLSYRERAPSWVGSRSRISRSTALA
jgi:hypothetical protein